jgi:hypothetical protein
MPTISQTPYTSPYPATIIQLSHAERFPAPGKLNRGKTITTITITPPYWSPPSPIDQHQDIIEPASFRLQGHTASGRHYEDPDMYLLGDIPHALPPQLQGLVSQQLVRYIAEPPPRLSPHAAHGLTPPPRSQTLLQRLLPSKKARGL